MADEGNETVLVANHARHTLDRGAERSSGTDGDDHRNGRPQFLLKKGRGTFGDAEYQAVRAWIGRRDLAEAEIEPIRELRGKLHAGGDGMVQTEGNQPFREGQRYQPLGGRPRYVQLPRDLVLGVSGDEIEPAGTGSVFEARLLKFRPIHRPAFIS